jgi:methylmalonyl-CoA mutase
VERTRAFQTKHATEAEETLRRLRAAVSDDRNVFGELMAAARVCTLGQITDAFFEVGGQYRRNV